jgi:hypothetical protein
MASCLPANEGVDSPPAIKPGIHAEGCGPSEDL